MIESFEKGPASIMEGRTMLASLISLHHDAERVIHTMSIVAFIVPYSSSIWRCLVQTDVFVLRETDARQDQVIWERYTGWQGQKGALSKRENINASYSREIHSARKSVHLVKGRYRLRTQDTSGQLLHRR